MKTYSIIASIALVAMTLSCSKEATPVTEGQECLVSLCPVGEISTSDSPLTKISDSSNDIYVVDVVKGTTPYAFGFFDNYSDMKLYLKTGSDYTIYMCLVRNAKTLIGDYFSLTNDGVCGSQSSVFNLGTSRYFPLNRFSYNSNFNSYRVYYYSSSTATSLSTASASYNFSNIGKGWLNNVYYPTCSDWFFAKISGYSPSGNYQTLNIDLKRTGFQLKYELSGVTDGEVTVKIYNDTRTFIENTTNTASYSSDTQFIAFKDAYSAWLYADNYTENLSVQVVWKRGIGVTQDLGTKTIQVKRNCLNNVRIALGSDDRGAGVNLTTEAESSMGNASTDVTAGNL